jgi:hypothetical protein
MKNYIGISKYLGTEAIRSLLEPDYDTRAANEKSYFERVLGADYIEPGSYEIYERKHFPGETFDSNFIKRLLRLLPIQVEWLSLDDLDFSEIRAVFFLKNSGSVQSGAQRVHSNRRYSGPRRQRNELDHQCHRRPGQRDERRLRPVRPLHRDQQPRRRPHHPHLRPGRQPYRQQTANLAAASQQGMLDMRRKTGDPCYWPPPRPTR